MILIVVHFPSVFSISGHRILNHFDRPLLENTKKGLSFFPPRRFVPESVDWRYADKNPAGIVGVSPVGNQQKCGGCW